MSHDLNQSDASLARRELYDEEFVAAQRALGRRRVMFITLISTLGGALILGSFLVYGWYFGEKLPVRKRDRFALVTAETVSEVANGLSIRLDEERMKKTRDRNGTVHLVYEYQDGPLEIRCQIDVYEDDVLSRNAFAEQGPAAINNLNQNGYSFSSPARMSTLGNESSYGSISINGEKDGHFIIIRSQNKVLRCEIKGHHFDDRIKLGRLLTQATEGLEVYKP